MSTATHHNGYTPYLIEHPPSGALLRFWNEANGQRWTGYVAELGPAYNVAYLWWTLTGIERMRRQGG